jgi:hypothetical protein
MLQKVRKTPLPLNRADCIHCPGFVNRKTCNDRVKKEKENGGQTGKGFAL